MDAYSKYRIQGAGAYADWWALAEIQMREVFFGPDVISGGVATAVGDSIIGVPENAIDGDPNTNIAIRTNGPVEYWQYDFPAPVKIREYTLLTQSSTDFIPDWDFMGWNGAEWEILDSRREQTHVAGVVRTFSLYELAGTAKFSDGVIAAGGFINRTDTGAKVADISPGVDGDFSALLPDSGPFDLLITRGGYRPLVQVEKLASDA